ncbi:SDR family NAD(P)-dependent oxidoreductase [Yinghuangia sp. YIM S10712]|uniref:SDR family NAD(P)-dependent oxidoreductase n=1 Tax=Yinghuangia sp. YIM S10712 TaxID=3436930 RepID=UPI003F53D2E4
MIVDAHQDHVVDVQRVLLGTGGDARTTSAPLWPASADRKRGRPAGDRVFAEVRPRGPTAPPRPCVARARPRGLPSSPRRWRCGYARMGVHTNYLNDASAPRTSWANTKFGVWLYRFSIARAPPCAPEKTIGVPNTVAAQRGCPVIRSATSCLRRWDAASGRFGMDLGLAGAAVVQGGTQGMGRATAECLATDGARVAVIARTRSDLDKTVRDLLELGAADVVGLQTDITQGDEVIAADRTRHTRAGQYEESHQTGLTVRKGGFLFHAFRSAFRSRVDAGRRSLTRPWRPGGCRSSSIRRRPPRRFSSGVRAVRGPGGEGRRLRRRRARSV